MSSFESSTKLNKRAQHLINLDNFVDRQLVSVERTAQELNFQRQSFLTKIGKTCVASSRLMSIVLTVLPEGLISRRFSKAAIEELDVEVASLRDYPQGYPKIVGRLSMDYLKLPSGEIVRNGELAKEVLAEAEVNTHS